MNKTTNTTLDEKADSALGGMKRADPSEDTTRDGNTKSSSIGCHLDTITEEEEDEGDEQGEQKENEETPHYNAKEVYRKVCTKSLYRVVDVCLASMFHKPPPSLHCLADYASLRRIS